MSRWTIRIIGILLLAYGTYRVGKVFDVFSSRYELAMLVPSVLGLRDGRIVFDGSPEEMVAADDPYIKQFLS